MHTSLLGTIVLILPNENSARSPGGGSGAIYPYFWRFYQRIISQLSHASTSLCKSFKKRPLLKHFFLKHVEIQGDFHFYPRWGLAAQLL